MPRRVVGRKLRVYPNRRRPKTLHTCIELIAVMNQLVEKVKRSGHPGAPKSYLLATLGEELAKRTKPPNKQYFGEGEDIALDFQK